MLTDIVLFVILVAAILLGVGRGSVRQLLAFGAWLVTFIVAAYARAPLSEWVMGQFPAVSREHAYMTAFVLAFLVLFGIALIVVQVTGLKVQLTMRPFVDEAIGGAVMFVVAVLAISSVILALDTYYAGAIPGEPEVSLINNLHDALGQSAIATNLRQIINPVLLGLLGPLLPADVRAPG